jgi:hypothetical protein
MAPTQAAAPHPEGRLPQRGCGEPCFRDEIRRKLAVAERTEVPRLHLGDSCLLHKPCQDRGLPLPSSSLLPRQGGADVLLQPPREDLDPSACLYLPVLPQDADRSMPGGGFRGAISG